MPKLIILLGELLISVVPVAGQGTTVIERLAYF